ncbi:MAG: hypothetical protein ACMVY4_12535 [Minwuia sp.]|uniref:hypothetical protein n=1 Tax=Minwuia sp. TaxID=2493630 RepID=UPI003A84726D
MPTDAEQPLALSTKLEEDFITPLTALRGVLEIFRDFDDLTEEERRRFAESALEDCLRLERGIDDLAVRVYADTEAPVAEPVAPSVYADRVEVLRDRQVIDLDFSGFVFSGPAVVDEFYDYVERLVEETGQDWYFTVNYRNCAVWPEAWVAYAHRAKRLQMSHALGTARYSADASAAEARTEGGMLQSRAAAIEFLTKRRNGPS